MRCNDFQADPENGNIEDFPPEVFDTPKQKVVVNPCTLLEMIGSETIPLEEHPIYIWGKRKGSSEANFFTKIKIESKAEPKNLIQGLLGIRFLGGYAYEKFGRDSSLMIKRPTFINTAVTEDTGQFKLRAVIVLNGVVVDLKSAEPFCKIPLMDDRLLAKVDKPINVNKRRKYAQTNKTKNKWSHVNRTKMEHDNHKSLVRMVLHYKNNLPETEYVQEFVKDLVKACFKLNSDFRPNADNTEIQKVLGELAGPHGQEQKPEPKLNCKRRLSEALLNHSPNLDTTSLKNLKKISSSEISWMSLLGFSLKLDERLSPSETVLQRQFFGQANVRRVVQMVASIDNGVSHGNVVDVMHDIFTQALGEKGGITNIAKINDMVVARIQRRKMASNTASQISRRVGFETSKIPKTILPRPSFSLESDDDDKFYHEFI